MHESTGCTRDRRATDAPARCAARSASPCSATLLPGCRPGVDPSPLGVADRAGLPRRRRPGWGSTSPTSTTPWPSPSTRPAQGRGGRRRRRAGRVDRVDAPDLPPRTSPTAGLAAAAARRLVVTLSLCLASVPRSALSGRYAVTQADLVTHVFEDNESATIPADVTVDGPVGRPRPGQRAAARRRRPGRPLRHPHRQRDPAVDEHPHRRHRDVQPAAQHDERASSPRTARCTTSTRTATAGYGDPAAYMLNAIYGQVPALHPGILGRSANEGADVVKQAVEGTLGRPGRLLPPGEPRRVQGDRQRDGWRDGQHQRADRDPGQHRTPVSRRSATSSRGRTSGSTATRRCGSPAAVGAPTTTSACCGSGA